MPSQCLELRRRIVVSSQVLVQTRPVLVVVDVVQRLGYRRSAASGGVAAALEEDG